MEITDKKALIAEISSAVLEAIHYGVVVQPPDLHTKSGLYTEAARKEFFELHHLVEQTINSHILNEQLSQIDL